MSFVSFAQTTQTFNSSGSFTVPAGVTSITVQAWGAGGAGGGSTNAGSGIARGGAGGGGGAYATATISVTPGQVLPIVVGAGGTGVSATNGNAGGDSTITGYTTTIYADGGSGGAGNTSGGAPTGGAGGTVANSKGTSIAGGSGTNGATGYGITSGPGGTGANSGGAGGAGVTIVGNTQDGNVGTQPGGGGSGGRTSENSGSKLGGAGGAGRIILSYCPSDAGTLSGNQYICSYTTNTTTLSSTVPGGTWSTSNASIATVNASTGVVTGVALGTVTITYTVASAGCTTTTATRVVYVSNGPGAGPLSVTGSTTQCLGTTATYTITPDPYSSSYSWTYTGSNVTVAVAADQLSATLTFGTAATNGNIIVSSTNGCGSGSSGSSYFYVTVSTSSSNTVSIASSTPTVCINTALTNITHTTTRATGISNAGTTGANGLPAGVAASWNNNTITIFGTPSTVGIFTYSIPLVGGCGTVNAAGTITVTPATVGGTITGSAAVCSGTNSTTLTLSGHTGTVTRWESSTSSTFSSSVTSISNTTTTLTATNRSATTYYRAVLKSGSCSSVNSATATVTVYSSAPNRPASGSITGTATQCPALTGQTYSVTAVANATTYNWSVPTGWSITAGAGTTSITVTTGSSGQGGNISVTAQNACGTSESRTFAVTVSAAAPATPGTITGTAAQCPAVTAQTYSVAAVTNATSYNWTVPTGWSITAGSGTRTITVTTGAEDQDGNISVTAQNACGTSAAQTLAVTVSPAKPATPSAAAGSNETCTTFLANWAASTNATTYFLDVSTVNNFGSFVTGFNNLNVGNVTSQTVTGLTAGATYYYRVRANNSCGTSSNSTTITDLTSPSPATPGTITGTAAQCPALTTQTYSVTAVANATTYNWTVPTGWSITAGAGTNSITVTTGSAGQGGNISVTAQNSCTTSSARTLAVTVVSNNTVGVASSTPTVCINTALTNITHTTTGATGIANAGTIGANGLPAGVAASWNSNTITIFGTPAASGTFTYSIPLVGGCGTANATGTITVSTATSGGSVAGSATVCTGTNSTALTLSGYTGDISRWESSTSSTFASGVTSISNTTTTLTATNLTATTYYRAVLTSGACSSQSSTATITVNPKPVIANKTVTTCSGVGFSVAPTNGTDTVPSPTRYSWTAAQNVNVSGENSGFDQATIDGTLINNSSSNQTVIYTVVPTATTGLCDGDSFTVTVTVVPASVGGTIAGSSAVCTSTNATTLTLSGHTGAITRWESSISSTFASGVTNISNTTTTLIATNLTATTYYRAVVTSSGCTAANSATATVTVFAGAPARPASGSITGTATQCPALTGQTYSVAAVANTTTYNWTVPTGWSITAGAGTTSITVTTGLGGQNGNISVTAQNACGTSSSRSFAVTVSSAAVGGTIAGSTAVCTGTNSTSLTLSGQTGTITRWESSLDNFATAGTNIANTTTTLTATNLTATTYYRAVLTRNSCPSLNSTIATVTVNPVTVGGTIDGDETVCSGTNSTTLTLSGHTGAIARWESSTSSTFASGVTNISNTTTTLTATNLTATTYYRAVLKSGACSSANSTTGTITVTPSNTITLTSAAGSNSQSLCDPGEFVVITYATTGATGATFSGLPPNLSGSWSANVVTISGTPTVSGTFNYTVTLTGGCGTVTATGTFASYTTRWSVNSGVGSWSNGTPNESVGAVIASNYSENFNLTACTLTVTNNAVITVPSGVTYTIAGKLNVQSGTLTFENGSSLLQTNYTGANSGNIVYKRNTAAMCNNYDYSYWGSPVASQALSGIWMSVNSPYTFYSYSSSDANWISHSSNQVMAPAFGYIARSRNGGSGTDYSGTTTMYTCGTPWKAKFHGVPNNGDYTVPVNGANGYTDNLLANPYPSAIDLVAFKNDPSNAAQLSGNFYFWTHNIAIASNTYNTSDYAIFNVALNAGVNTSSGGMLVPDRYVDAGQGFFAEGAANGNVTFKNTHRVAGHNSSFYRLNNTATTAGLVESHKIWLDITNVAGLYKQQLLTYTQGATMGFEQTLDAKTFDGNGYIDFYSIAADEKLTIQSRSFPFITSDVVPLGYKTTVAGAYKIKIDHVDGLFLGNQNIYLRDNLLNVIHDIKASEYAFTSSVGTFNGRFEIVYNNPNLATPTFTQVSAICSGTTLAALPTTSNNGINGTWSPALNNTATTTYTFTPAAGQNATTASMTITVNDAVAGTISANQTIISGMQPADITLTASSGEIQWQQSTDNSTFTDITGATSSILTSIQIGALTANRFFRAVVKSGSCADVFSGVVSITVVSGTAVCAAQCGATLAALSTDIMVDNVVGATEYRFKVVANGATNVIERGFRRYFNLTMLPSGAFYNTAYTISVAVMKNNAWGDYGAECIVTTPALPTTQVRAAQCGATLATNSTDILADNLQFATAYRFKVVVNGDTYEVNPIGTRRYFKLTLLPITITAGTTYTISVAAQFNGAWGTITYGPECNVTTPGAADNSRQAISIATNDFSLVAYPNPSNSIFNLQVKGASNDAVSILVFDITGRQIENKVLDATAIENITIGQNYSAGIYNVIVSQGMNSRTVRLVKN